MREVKAIVYESWDGNKFITKEECLQYEQEHIQDIRRAYVRGYGLKIEKDKIADLYNHLDLLMYREVVVMTDKSVYDLFKKWFNIENAKDIDTCIDRFAWGDLGIVDPFPTIAFVNINDNSAFVVFNNSICVPTPNTIDVMYKNLLTVESQLLKYAYTPFRPKDE